MSIVALLILLSLYSINILLQAALFLNLREMCINEEQRRAISSTITGQIFNTMQDEWQELTDALHKFAVLHGDVSMIELDDPRVGDLWLDFFIGYDDAASAKKFVDCLEALNGFNPVNHIQVIGYTTGPQPQPQP